MKITTALSNEASPQSITGFFNFRHWTIGRRITVGFALVIAVAAGLGGFALLQVRSLSREFTKVIDESIPGLERIAQVQLLATQNRLLVFKHISSSNKDDMQHLEQQITDNSRAISEALDAYVKLATDAQERAICEAIQTVRAEYLTKIKQILDLSRGSSDNVSTYALARTELDPVGVRYAAVLKAASDHENASAQKNSTAFQSSIVATKRGVAGGLAVAIIIGGLVGLVIIRSTARVLRSLATRLPTVQARWRVRPIRFPPRVRRSLKVRANRPLHLRRPDLRLRKWRA